MSIIDYTEAGFRTFPLWNITSDNKCECGQADCKAVGKHPRMSNWQHSPVWSFEQLEIMEDTGQIRSGFGVCVDGYLVIDIDPRNGGNDSFEKLKKDTKTDYEKESSFVVQTGGGGLHIYFELKPPVALVSHLKKYPGIDFKSSGYTVGYGSMHRSGNEYERKKGFPQDVGAPPQVLIDLLRKQEHIRANIGADYVDVSETELKEMLSFVSPDCSYDQWISIGMSLHEATQGTGVDLWDSWSSSGASYDDEVIDRHWQSFGKCSNPVTLGTLVHYAEEAGWKRSVTFTELSDSVTMDEPKQNSEGLPFDIDSVDVLKPPGFIGEVAEWINSQCRFPRERLAVATAINTIGCIGGLRHVDDYNGITSNTLILCVAGSGTGKESVQQAGSDLFRAAGLSAAVHGAIKSEQEITRNIVRHQPAYYIIDELGYLLHKIENARKRGGASYLDGVIGSIMSIYTKASGYYLIGGDLKDDIRRELLRELSMCEKKIEENEDKHGTFANKRKSLVERAIPSVDDGIENPFLSLIGYTTPVSFDELVTGEQATNGFIARTWIVREHETNPKRKRGFKAAPMPSSMRATLQIINQGGVTPYDKVDRIEWYSDKVNVNTTEKAKEMLEAAADWFEEEAERQKAATGLEAIVRRGYELMAKISFILAIPGRLREPEHVRYAYAVVKADLKEKLRLAQTNILSSSKNASDGFTVLRNTILDITGGEGERLSVIKRRAGKKFKTDDIEKMIEILIERKELEKVEIKTSGRPSVRFKAT